MEQQGKPQIPSLKDSQKPQVKIKGLQAGLSLFDRLKQFKKKDLAFITAGLGVLFMAPLAEHFMMAPEQGTMKEGWDIKPSNQFGGGNSPYENGVNGLAPGGVTGGGDVITPLNVRDPSALVMGPGATQQPPATSTTPPPPPPSKSEGNDWKDAIANAAATGAKKAVEKASLPVPKPSLTNAGLRGLGAVAGGGGASFSNGPISSQGLTGNKASQRDFQRVSGAPGFKGVATRGSTNGGGGLDRLKAAANGAVDGMNRGGPASSAAEAAANMAMGSGGGGSDRGAGSDGAADKAASGSQSKDSSSVGESLEFLRRKAEQDKAIDLKWKLKEKAAMMWPNLKEKIAETLVMDGLVKPIAKGFGDALGSLGSNKATGAGKTFIKCTSHPGSEWAKDPWSVGKGGELMYGKDKEGNATRDASNATGCSEFTKGGPQGPGGNTQVPGNGSLSGVGKGAKSGKTLKEMCEDLSKPDPNNANGGEVSRLRSHLQGMITKVHNADVAIGGGAGDEYPGCAADNFVTLEGTQSNINSINLGLRTDMKQKVHQKLENSITLTSSGEGIVNTDGTAARTEADGALDAFAAEKDKEKAAIDKAKELRAAKTGKPEDKDTDQKLEDDAVLEDKKAEDAKNAAAAALDKAIAAAQKQQTVFESADAKIAPAEKAYDQLKQAEEQFPGILKRLDSVDGGKEKAAKLADKDGGEGNDAFLGKTKVLLDGATKDKETLDTDLSAYQAVNAKDADRLGGWIEDVETEHKKVETAYTGQVELSKKTRASYDAAVEGTTGGEGDDAKQGVISIAVTEGANVIGSCVGNACEHLPDSQKDVADWAKDNITGEKINAEDPAVAAKNARDTKAAFDKKAEPCEGKAGKLSPNDAANAGIKKTKDALEGAAAQ